MVSRSKKKTPQKILLCVGCNSPLKDQFYYSICDKSWHHQCLKCFDCKAELVERCYSREGHLFCKNDFHRNFGRRCDYCKEPILKEDKVRTVKHKHFHNSCLKCSVCEKIFSTGDKLYLSEGSHYFCHAHVLASNISDPKSEESADCDMFSHDEDLSIPHSVPSFEEMVPSIAPSDDIEYNSDGNARRRGPRTTIKSAQLELLRQAFALNPKPPRVVREQLAIDTGLNMRVIQVWYQNRRSKERRLRNYQGNDSEGRKKALMLSNLDFPRAFFPPDYNLIDPIFPPDPSNNLNQMLFQSANSIHAAAAAAAHFPLMYNEGNNVGLEAVTNQNNMNDLVRGMAPYQYRLPDNMTLNSATFERSVCMRDDNGEYVEHLKNYPGHSMSGNDGDVMYGKGQSSQCKGRRVWP